MNYRAIIKQKFPIVERAVRRYTFLMRLAIKVELFLRHRQMKAELNQFKTLDRNNTVVDMSLLQRAKAENLFDFQWYCDNQKRAFSSEEEAFRDYIHKSVFSSVSPAPAFDNTSYIRSNLDAYYSNVSPLVHYLTIGKKYGNGQTPSHFSPKWKPTDRLIIKPDAKLINNLKVAICLHIFYPDFIEYYARCIKQLSIDVDLFISISDSKFKSEVNEKLASLSNVNNVDIAVVPNRGRNFGPMLVEFGKKLLNYDLFCHLHSKKSLYSGREQTQWADYLGEYLLHDPLIVAKMLTHMVQNDSCGIYYPTSFFMMPDWVNHWLKNKPFRGRFYEEWGLTDKSDFLPYPVGGMFWAKPKALKQLLEKSYEYDDFPPEPLPNDGSELHALERCIGLLAEKNGYSQLFYYPELGAFTYDKTYIFSNYVNSTEQVLHKLLPFSTISFDVFDTLVRRSHHEPDYAKLKLGKQLLELGEFTSAIEFVELRNSAELSLRKQRNFQGDINIFEVYEHLASQFNWSVERAHEFAELEFAYDLDMLESKDEMVEIINCLITHGKQVYIISDTYYTEHQIVLMLRKAGVATGYKLFVSSELGLRKDNGTMWSHISTIVKDKSSFVHVGDNAVADAQIPGDFGLSNLHILNPEDKWQSAGWNNQLVGNNKLNEKQILKWGPLMSKFGRFPFLGE